MDTSPLTAIASAGESGLDNVLTNANFPGIAILATSGVLGMIFVIRQMVKFQREFTNFYVEENQKLRVRVDELEQEVQDKVDAFTDLKVEQGRLRRLCEEHEHTIERLNRIIERRKLEREEE